jgi:tRNA A-37 threonylcarbamoyl transferase component Bud32
MSLTPGSRVGVYEVIAPLGAGGMGEVYRARDAKLQRDVAIKILIAAVADDADRLARFNREAQVLASLNHPNIAAIYGFEDSAIVMELVEGPTLADRLQTGAMPLDEAVEVAKQICDALSVAHEAGIIHRDLKPANIKIRPDGTVKVLDFGLAKALEPAGGSGVVTNSPTLSIHATQHGLILGTAAYMAPEQARGRPVERRADIWAFGVVLFEMLTGHRAFEGDDVSITLASVLKDDVQWKALPASVPSSVRRLLRRCLQKDPRRRLSSIGDARLELDDVGVSEELVSSSPVVPMLASSRIAWAIAAAAIAVAVSLIGLWQPWRVSAAAPSLVFEIPAPEGATSWGSQMQVSPDERHIVTRVGLGGGRAVLWIRSLDRTAAREIPGTSGASFPFWAPDSKSVGFFANGKLHRVDIDGGVPVVLADAQQARGGTWNRRGDIVFAPAGSGPLFRVSSNGGPRVQISVLDASRGETAHRFPRFLPDDMHFVYHAISSQPDRTGIHLAGLEGTPPTLLMASLLRPEFVAPDLLVYLRDTRLFAQRVDLASRTMSGEPRQVGQGIFANAADANAALSITKNLLAFVPGENTDRRQLMWMGADGKPGSMIGAEGLYNNPRLAPDGSRLAVYLPDGGGDLWLYDLERATNTRFTFDPASDNEPLWSPDGSRIAFVSDRDGGVFNLYEKNAGGAGEDRLLLKTANNKTLNDWSPDGRYLLYQEIGTQTQSDLWALPLFGDRKPFPVLNTRFGERAGAFSPDGRWVAYHSDESGINQVYVQTFPVSGSKWQVSTARGSNARWSPDGKRLFYDRTGQMMAVDVIEAGGGRFRAGAPKQLFAGLQALGPHNYDVAGDGTRFVVVTMPGNLGITLAPINVVMNWPVGPK